MQDAWRAYLELALGVTEASRKKAEEIARKLVGKGGATAAQLQALADEVRAISAANREALTRLVRSEIERALGALGLATTDEVAELTRRVGELERELQELRTRVAADAVPAAAAGAAAAAVLAEPTETAVGEPASSEPEQDAGGERKPVKNAGKKVAKKAVKKAVKAAGKRATEEGSGEVGEAR